MISEEIPWLSKCCARLFLIQKIFKQKKSLRRDGFTEILSLIFELFFGDGDIMFQTINIVDNISITIKFII